MIAASISATMKGRCIWRWATNTERQDVLKKAGISAKLVTVMTRTI